MQQIQEDLESNTKPASRSKLLMFNDSSLGQARPWPAATKDAAARRSSAGSCCHIQAAFAGPQEVWPESKATFDFVSLNPFTL